MNMLQDDCDGFFDYCQNSRRLSKNTLRVYQFDLASFNRFLAQEEPPITDYNEVTKITLQNYLSTLGGYSVKTIKRKFACLRSLFHYLEYQERITQNPFSRFQLNMREPYHLRTTMSFEEVKMILSAAYGEKPGSLPERNDAIPAKSLKITSEEFIWYRDVAILELLFVGGLRVSELCGLMFQDINLKYSSIMIHGKGNKERLIFLENGEVLLALKSYLYHRINTKIDSKYIFLTKFGQKLSTQAVRNLVTKFSGLAGITKNITPHVFRHTFATLLLEEGVDIKYIQDFLGHSSISTTQIYLHTTNKQKRNIIANMHPRQRLNFSEISSADNVKLTSSEGRSCLSSKEQNISPSEEKSQRRNFNEKSTFICTGPRTGTLKLFYGICC